MGKAFKTEKYSTVSSIVERAKKRFERTISSRNASGN
jgi:hypothetical protein